ncbi:MAG: PAS domain S-box protein [Desulfobacterales bacterium]|nr:PAS domain S-box protein [Desulfobacterales bacterium]
MFEEEMMVVRPKDTIHLINKLKINVLHLEVQNQELKQRIEIVKKSEEKYRNLFKYSKDGIIFVNMKGEIIESNKAFQDLLCYTIEELKNFNIDQLTPEKWHNMENEIIKKGDYYEYEKEYVKKNGEVLPVSIKMTKVKDEQGEPSYIACIVRDISMYKKYGAQISHKENIEFIKILAGGIAHNFNNILSPIIGGIDLAKQHIQNDDFTLNLLDHALIAANRAKNLVKIIMNFVLKDKKENSAVDLSLLLEEYTEFLRSVLPKSITLKNSKMKKIKINGNENNLKQLFINIGLNAANSIKSYSGIIEVEIDEVDFSESFPKPHFCLKNGKYAVLTFKDTGNGIEKDKYSTIFTPFFTTNNNVFYEGKGAGLGLTIAEKIAKDHGGAITVDSAVGKGSRFSVFLPIQS